MDFRLATIRADKHIKDLRINNRFKGLFKHSLILDKGECLKTSPEPKIDCMR